MSTDFNKILPKKVRTVYHQEIDEKTDTDINDLLKGHKSIIEENNILKIHNNYHKISTFYHLIILILIRYSNHY